jgi:1-acyl-sn-glycerol-3-phosphate acyltransferase
MRISWWIGVGLAILSIGLYWVVELLLITIGALILRLWLGEIEAQREAQRWLAASFLEIKNILVFYDIVDVDYIDFYQFNLNHEMKIIAPNHPSIWDAIFVLAAVSPMSCVLKSKLMTMPLIGGGATAAGLIPHQPAAVMLRRCVTQLRQNGALLFFPEGTRTEVGQQMMPLKGAIAIVAKQTGATVYPVWIETSSCFLRKGQSLWSLPKQPIEIKIKLLSGIKYEEEDTEELFLQKLEKSYLFQT